MILKDSAQPTPLRELERTIRNSRTNQLFNLVNSNNVDVSTTIYKLDPNVIVFTFSGELSEPQRISKINPDMLENNVKIVNLKNPKASPYCGEGIFEKSDVDRTVELGVEGIVLDNIN